MSEILNADHEYRAHAAQHASLRLWLRLLSCTTRVEDKIRQKLRESFDITPVSYTHLTLPTIYSV